MNREWRTYQNRYCRPVCYADKWRGRPGTSLGCQTPSVSPDQRGRRYDSVAFHQPSFALSQSASSSSASTKKQQTLLLTIYNYWQQFNLNWQKRHKSKLWTAGSISHLQQLRKLSILASLSTIQWLKAALLISRVTMPLLVWLCKI